MKAKTYVKGNKELQAALRKLAAAGDGHKLVPAVNAGLSIIQNEIQENAPYLTGTYRRSWHLGEAEASGNRAYNTTGTDLPYALRLEYGFEDTDARGRSYHQAAQPHVRPAFDNKREEALKEVKDAIVDLVSGATGK